MRLTAIGLSLLFLPATHAAPFGVSAIAPKSSNLLRGLCGYWHFDELSGMRYDQSANGNHLTNVNSATVRLGKNGNAAAMTATATQYFTGPNSASLQMGDVDFTIAAWVRLESLGANRWVVGKDNTSPAGARDYDLYYSHGATRFQFIVFRATDSGVSLNADSLGTPATNVWYFIVAQHNAATDTMSIQVNNGTVDSKATGGALQAAGGAAFQVGEPALGGANNYMNGCVDNLGIWKRVLTADELTQLYSGYTFPFFKTHYSPWISDSSNWKGSILGESAQPTINGVIWQNYGVMGSSGSALFASFYGTNIQNWINSGTDAETWGAQSILGSGGTGGDSNHNYTSMVVDNDGYIHTCYGAHATALYYRKSTNPYDATAWGSETTISTVATYPALICDQANKLYLFYRGNAANGRITRELSMRTSTDSGANWSAETILIDSEDTSNGWTYHGLITRGDESPQNSIHIPWTWRWNYGVNDSSQYTNTYYMTSADGGSTWLDPDGNTYTLPVTPTTAVPVLETNYLVSVSATLDTNAVPYLLSLRSNDVGYFTNSTAWLSTSASGSWASWSLPGNNWYGNPELFIDANNVLTLVGSHPVSGRLQLCTTRSTDGGTNWTTLSALTELRGSDQLQVSVTPAYGTRPKAGWTWVDSAGRVRYIERRQ